MWRILALLCMGLSVAQCEVFTALVDLENVIYTEDNMLGALDEYIKQEEERLAMVKSKAEKLRSMHRGAADDIEHYLGHPVNAFLLVKRFLWEWVDVENWIKYDGPQSAYLRNITGLREHTPGHDDLKGATAALLRLQDTYNLETRKIASGEIEGTRTTASLTSQECFELGRVAYNHDDQYHARLWISEAYRRYQNETAAGQETEIQESVLLDYLAYSSFMQGHLVDAVTYTNRLLEIEPSHERAQNNKAYFENELRQKEKPRGETGDMDAEVESSKDASKEEEKEEEKKEEIEIFSLPERKMYEALCRGDRAALKVIRNTSILRCSYQHYNHPLLYLQPAKEEVIFDEPRLYFYRDIISDTEIKFVKRLAAPRLQRATIQNSITGNLEFADYRISKSAWLRPEEDAIIRRIRRRVAAYSGLELETAEDLQVVNYGIGGHYEPHFDFARIPNAYHGIGNRIATMLFYLSDVEAGGATVFTRVGARVRPEKGTAVFWYNLFKNGEGNYDTRHAACPVLAGSKWGKVDSDLSPINRSKISLDIHHYYEVSDSVGTP
ncbi:prolyl 4-hydroxylase subunit alpha-1-like isoform X3 [Diadema antillarum]|uniref:prolyl 4-hydroxylase subunit alpha-1-like isoform X3 n=1 Tax=Diadema antillarum TaxID=105358 RepID=UPI003A84E540